MIPVRLRLRNFMCYREDVPPLDFRGIHLACLCGDNGNGKSAIIDAMTWALWGKARAGSIDDLIYTLAQEMEVEFDFTVGQDLYRVLRKRTRPKKRSAAGQSSLDLFALEGETARPLSGNVIAETERQIIDLLHMDYDTFVNSAYLRQGHADEFTRQPAGKRKDVLAAILDLSQYDELEEKAREQAKTYEDQAEVLKSSLGDIAEELARRPEIEAAAAEAEKELETYGAAAREAEERYDELRRRVRDLETQQAQLNDLTARTAETDRQLKTWQEQADNHRAGIARYEGVIARREEIEKGSAAYTAARKAAEDLNALARRDATLKLRKAELEKVIGLELEKLNNRQDSYRKEVDKLEERVKALPEQRRQLDETRQQLAALAERERKLAEDAEAVRGGQAAVSRLEADVERLERETKEVREKLDLLVQHRASHEDAKCPLCESELTQEGLALIEQKYTQERDEKTAALERQRAALVEAGMAAERLKNAHAGMDADLKREQTTLHSRIGKLEQEIGSREEDETRLVNGREYVAAVTGQLERKEYAVEEQRQLAAVETELQELGYDEVKHEAARSQADALQGWEKEQTALDEAARRIEEERAGLARAEENIAGLQQQVFRAGEQKADFEKELEGLPALKEQAGEAEKAHREAAAARDAARQAVGRVTEQLARLKEMESRQKERQRSLDEAVRDAGIYRELTRAFGKSGIQALLIESALPDIENEANRLLARMTDNRMSVNFKTQQETKAGTVRETLDITITDELGTRDYEMFSGGEAFRINFAIRIALSRLLANRAGAPLPTLIIDEGFGTQDASGLEKLKEAINSIQDDFEKILVITHMDELKDAFPTRIEVVKSGAGSSITVS